MPVLSKGFMDQDAVTSIFDRAKEHAAAKTEAESEDGDASSQTHDDAASEAEEDAKEGQLVAKESDAQGNATSVEGDTASVQENEETSDQKNASSVQDNASSVQDNASSVQDNTSSVQDNTSSVQKKPASAQDNTDSHVSESGTPNTDTQADSHTQTASNNGEAKSACCEHRYKNTERSQKFQANIQKRLNRAIGQLNGVKTMIDENRYCGDVLTQLAAAESAIRRTAEMILQDHMETCVVEEVRAGNVEVVDEAMRLIRKFM